MKNLIYFILILIIGLTSCDGRKSNRKALNDSIVEFKKNNTINVDTYIPETYHEQRIDTTLANGVEIKIKLFTDMDNSIVFTKKKDTINYYTNYRQYKFEITVIKSKNIIYNESFDKERINRDIGYIPNLNKDAPIYNFDSLAILKSIGINHELSLEDNSVYIDISYSIPTKDYIDNHILKIDLKGNSNFITTQLR